MASPLSRLRSRWTSRGVPEGIRITRVGLWFVLFTVVVGVAATNTGNNALYLVLSAMLALLVVSGVVSRRNLQRLEIEVEPPGDLFARRPTLVGFAVRNRGRLAPRWLLLVALGPAGPWRLVTRLAPRRVARGSVEMIFPRRGRHRLEWAHVASLFPLGLFRKGLRYRILAEGRRGGIEVLVYPELFAAGEVEIVASGYQGDRTAARAGWGHELHALRAFRPGDDPRGIHWKKSAQTGALVYQERETEETLRLSILLDNGIRRAGRPGREGGLAAEEVERFERLVSEAATAAWDHLDRDFEVELVTRERRIDFGKGARQRRELMTALALVEPVAPERAALVAGDPGARVLRLGPGDRADDRSAGHPEAAA